MYEQQNFLVNCGVIFIIMCTIICLVFLSMILGGLGKVSRIAMRISRKLNGVLYWNLILRNVMELSLEFAIIALMDIAVQNW